MKKKKKELAILDQRRANNILIEIKSLPAPRHLKSALLNMDDTHFNKEIVDVSCSMEYGVCSIEFAIYNLEIAVEIDANRGRDTVNY